MALQSVSLLAQELTEQGVTTKVWTTRASTVRGGKPIDKVYIYKLLNNRILLGQLQVDGDWHPAAHKLIVSQALWDQAQALLSARRRPRKRAASAEQDFLLRGRVFGENGRAYSPWTSSVRGNRINKCYVPQKDIALGGGASGLPRLQAYAPEQQVMDHVHEHMKNPNRVLDHLPAWMMQHPEYSRAQFADVLSRIATVWPTLFSAFRNQMVLRVLDRVTVHPDGVTVRLHVEGFVELIREFMQGEALPRTVRDIFDRATTAKPRKPKR